MRITLEPKNRPWGSENEQPLSQKISRITSERGGKFATLNEAELEAEIANNEITSFQENQDRESLQESQEQDEKTFENSRAQLTQLVGSALNESALSLDFISLLVSSQRPQVGASSMSPMLKSSVPVGSLGADTISESSVPAPKLESAIAASGWKLLALEKASSILEDACSRLSSETEREDRYWQGVTKLVCAGEIVTRAKRGGPLVVKYGYGDSGSRYFDPGNGVLARKSDGEPLFQPQYANGVSGVAVRVYRDRGDLNERELISSDFMGTAPKAESGEEHDKIIAARNVLFERELMFHLVKEARLLGAYGVHIENQCVVCNAYGVTIEIESFEENSEHDEPFNNDLAHSINLALHLELCEFFRKNQSAAQNKSPPISSQDPPTAPQASLLRPVLAQVQHSIAAHRAVRLLELMIPNTQAIIEPLTKFLHESPRCIVRIGEISLEVRSPLDDDSATFVAHCSTSGTAQFSSLNELELWLRWFRESASI